jgi:DNA repair exonuclease SbcCD ATPase subunit
MHNFYNKNDWLTTFLKQFEDINADLQELKEKLTQSKEALHKPELLNQTYTEIQLAATVVQELHTAIDQLLTDLQALERPIRKTKQSVQALNLLCDKITENGSIHPEVSDLQSSINNHPLINPLISGEGEEECIEDEEEMATTIFPIEGKI